MAGTPIRFRGLQTADETEFLTPGQLVDARGSRQKRDSLVLHRSEGRTAFTSTGPGSGAASMETIHFNEAEDQVLEIRDTAMYIADVGITGTFSRLKDQVQDVTATAPSPDIVVISSAAPKLVKARLGDINLVAFGSDRPLIIENNLRARRLGLIPPTGNIQFTSQAQPTVLRPTATSDTSLTTTIGTFSKLEINNPSFLRDSDPETFASIEAVRLDDSNKKAVYEYTATFPSGPTSTWKLVINLTVANGRYTNFSQKSFFKAQYKIGAGIFRLLTFTGIGEGAHDIQKTLPGTIAPETVTVKFVSRVGKFETVSVSDIRLENLLSVTPEFSFATSNKGLRYILTEVREYQRYLPGTTSIQDFSVESDLGILAPPANRAAFTFGKAGDDIATGIDGLILTLPTPSNSDTTHFTIYRSQDALTDSATKAIDQFSRVGTVPVSEATWTDYFDDAGHPMDYQQLGDQPPFLIIGGIVVDSNTPPPPETSVVGSFGGHALYASDKDEGVFYYSQPLEPDYAPTVYSDSVPSKVTAFIDIGILLVFTTQSVHSYSFLTTASDFDFRPSKGRRDVSLTRGCISNRGATKFQKSSGEILGAFVSNDGIYLTNGAFIQRISQPLNWEATVDVTDLANTELIDYTAEQYLLFTYKDPAGVRQAMSFHYEADSIPYPLGPQRWPEGSTSSILQSDGTTRMYSEQDGRVWLEKNGTSDGLNLEGGNAITFSVKTGQIYPAKVDGKARLREVHFHTPISVTAPTTAYATVTATVATRVDGQPETTHVASFTLDTPGWKSIDISKDIESFNIKWVTTSQNFPGLGGFTATIEKTDDVLSERVDLA